MSQGDIFLRFSRNFSTDAHNCTYLCVCVCVCRPQRASTILLTCADQLTRTSVALPKKPSCRSVRTHLSVTRTRPPVSCSVSQVLALSTGKKGFEAFQRMDQLLAELQDEFYQNQETEITILWLDLNIWRTSEEPGVSDGNVMAPLMFSAAATRFTSHRRKWTVLMELTQRCPLLVNTASADLWGYCRETNITDVVCSRHKASRRFRMEACRWMMLTYRWIFILTLNFELNLRKVNEQKVKLLLLCFIICLSYLPPIDEELDSWRLVSVHRQYLCIILIKIELTIIMTDQKADGSFVLKI